MGKICLSIPSSTGTYLKSCLTPQIHYVTFNLEEDDGTIVARINLSFEQFARLLVSNQDTECTLERFRGKDGKLIVEKVELPESIHQRTVNNLGEVYSNLLKRIEDARRDVHELVNGNKKANKTNLENLLQELEVIKSHYVSNQSYVVKQSVEDVEKIQESSRSQLAFFLKDKFGINTDTNEIKKLEGVAGEVLSLPIIQEPVKENYELKQRQEKSIDDMTLMEVSEQLHTMLKHWEKKLDVLEKGKKYSTLFQSGSQHNKQNVIVWYVSYQGKTSLSLEEAREYLKFLKTTTKFKQHHHYRSEE